MNFREVVKRLLQVVIRDHLAILHWLAGKAIGGQKVATNMNWLLVLSGLQVIDEPEVQEEDWVVQIFRLSWMVRY